MKHQKYADTIRQKAEKQNPLPPPKPEIRLNRFNRLFLPALTGPLASLLYSPINRYIAVPKLGTGAPYIDMNGALVESYVSANTVVRILHLLLLLFAEIWLIRNTYGMHGWKKAGAILFGTVLNLIGGVIFLEFSLWS